MTDLTLYFYDQAFRYKPNDILDLWTCELFLLIAEDIILYSLVCMANTKVTLLPNGLVGDRVIF